MPEPEAPPASPSQTAKPRSRRRLVLLLAGILLALPLLLLLGLRLYFSDAYLQQRLQTLLEQALNRRVEIETLSASIGSGEIRLTGLVIRNADATFEGKELLRVEELQLACAPWPLLTSAGTELQALRLTVLKPRLRIDRRPRGKGSETNIDDLLEALTAGPPGRWPRQTGLRALQAQLRIAEGALLLHDSLPGMGDCALEGLSLEASLPALGQALQARLSASFKTPQVPQPGTLEGQVQAIVIDSGGALGPAQLQNLSGSLKLVAIDPAQAGKYLNLRYPLLGGQYVGSLGQPISGTLTFSAPSLALVNLTADLTTAGLIAVWEGQTLAANQFPARLRLQLESGWKDSQLRRGPLQAELALAATPERLAAADANPAQEGAVQPLRIHLTAGTPTAAGEEFVFGISGRLEEPCATDVGRILRLRGRLSGALEAQCRLLHARTGAHALQASLAFGQQAEAGSAPLLKLSLAGKVVPNAQGLPRDAELQVQGSSDFLTITSQGPGKLQALDDLANLSAEAQLRLELKGRPLWQAFLPLFQVLNLEEPLFEEVQGTLLLSGQQGQIRAKLAGQLRPIGAVQDPLRLEFDSTLDGAALAGAKAGAPYLAMGLKLEGQRQGDLQLTGRASVTAKDGALGGLSVDHLLRDLDILQLEAHLSREGCLRLQQLGWLHPEPLLVGTWDLKGTYELARDQARITECGFKGPALSLGVTTQFHVAALRASLAAASWSDRIKGIPAASLRFAAGPEAVQRLQALGLLSADPAFLAEWALNAQYDPQALQARLESFRVDGPLGILAGSVPAVDLKAVAAFLDSPAEKRDPGSLLRDLRLELQLRPPAFLQLRERRLLPAQALLEGNLQTVLRYDQAQDRLFLEGLRYERVAGGRSPVELLEMGLEVARVRSLLEARPESVAAVLPFLDKGLQVKTLRLASAECLELLTRMGVAEERLRDFGPQGRYRLGERLAVQDLKLSPPDEDGYQLSFRAVTPLTVLPAQPLPPGAAGEPGAAGLEGAWGFGPAQPLRILPAPDRIVFDGLLELGEAQLQCAAMAPAFVYRKQAAEPCQLGLRGSYTYAGELALSRLELKGGPLGLEAEGLLLRRGEKLFAQAQRIELLKGPWPFKARELLLDEARDLLRLEVEMPALELAEATRYARLPPHLKVAGRVEGGKFSYDGRFSALRQGFAVTDRLALRADAKGIQARLEQGEARFLWTVDGAFEASGTSVSGKSLTLRLEKALRGQAPLTQELTLPLEIAAKDPQQLLVNALQAEGLPIVVKAPLRSKAPVDLDALLEGLGALGGADPVPPPQRGSTGPALVGIRRLRLESSLSVPVLTFAGLQTQAVEAPSILLDERLLALPSLQAQAYEAKLTLKDGTYDLSKVRIGHNQKLVVERLNLRKFTAELEKGGPRQASGIGGRLTGALKTFLLGNRKNSSVSGILSADLALSGEGFEPAERASWVGQFKVEIPDLVVVTGEESGAEKVRELALGGLGGVLGTYGGSLGRSAQDLAQLSTEEFGLLIKRNVFEPLSIKGAIKEGLLKVERGNLRRKEQGEGLVADLQGDVSLVREAFSPSFRVWLMNLPDRTRNKLGLDQLDEADRKAILAQFQEGKFQPLVVTGTLAKPEYNLNQLREAYAGLRKRIDDLLEKKRKAAEAAKAAQAPPAGGTPAPAGAGEGAAPVQGPQAPPPDGAAAGQPAQGPAPTDPAGQPKAEEGTTEGGTGTQPEKKRRRRAAK